MHLFRYLCRRLEHPAQRRFSGSAFANTSRRLVPHRGVGVLGAMAVASLLMLQGLTIAGAATATQGIAQWKQAVAQIPLPSAGCFSISYPATSWTPVTCTTTQGAPAVPPPDYRQVGPETIGTDISQGTTGDYLAQTVGQISRVTGSLEISSGATEHSLVLTTGITNTNAYTLQINSKPFKSTACKTSPNPTCLGWQQFVYTTYFDGISMQDWVLFYDTTCPSGWKTFATYHPTIDCYKTSMRTSLASIPPVSALNNLKFMAFDTPGGNDTVKMTTPTTAATIKAAGQRDSVTTGGLGLANNWHVAEFDIFGDDDGNEAYFSSNTTLKAKMVLHDGTKTAPMCKQADSLTGERNNLNLAATPAFSTTQTSPTMLSRQSNSVAPGHGSCATAKGIGDTHLTTFDNVTRLYTFQAAGDFELATVTPTTTGPATGLRGAVVPATSTARSTTAPTTPAAPSTATPRKFSVQARQVSGAPTWPNADTNQAVAARVDTSDVALCTGPSRLEVNGGPVTLPGGGRITLPGGASVSNEAGTYVIRDANGDSLRAGIYTNGVPALPRVTDSTGFGRRFACDRYRKRPLPWASQRKLPPEDARTLREFIAFS